MRPSRRSANITGSMEEGKSPISSLWLLIALIIGILIFGDLTRRMTDARRMERDSRTLATEVAQLEAANAGLQAQIAQANDDAHVARWARSEAKLVLEGERLVVPLSASGSPEQEGTVTNASLETPSTWEIWWALLVGGQ